MKKVLVLGAGLVTRPPVRYLLDVPGLEVTVASRTVGKAQALIGGHPQGRAMALNVDDHAALEELIRQTDLAVSMLPYVYHPLVASLCVKHGKHMVTTSYVKDAMRALDGPAQEAGVLLLNEVGVDPGLDHMSAMKVIHDVESKGGKIASFDSWCGGLPAPEASDNPLGYKFSWSPKGVLLAGKNPARFLKDGQLVEIPGEELFDHNWRVQIHGLGEYECYPNRDSLPYMDTYGIHPTGWMFRGTLRNVGWCATLKRIAELGWLDDTPLVAPPHDLRRAHRCIGTRQPRCRPAASPRHEVGTRRRCQADHRSAVAGPLLHRSTARRQRHADRRLDGPDAVQDGLQARRA
jgi:saccharopine dehydrogenase (NADP+, L-glutamate forming)